MNSPGQDLELDVLQADLAALRGALDDGDDALAIQIAGSHDRHLRQYIERVGSGAAIDGLRSLLTLQHELTHEMLVRRDRAAALMRAQRASRNAASAYQTAQDL